MISLFIPAGKLTNKQASSKGGSAKLIAFQIRTVIMSTPKESIVIYAIPGSQFVFKVLAALQSKKIPHYVEFVPVANIEERKKAMPSGGYLVPEMKVGTGNDAIVVSDSEKILHWLDENWNANFFPSGASELSDRASNQTLAAMVWYYNSVDKDGFKRSSLLSLSS